MTTLIVGAGVFGLSLALELGDVVVIDREPPPVPHAASVDSSRIVRADYADPFYSALAADALELWRTDPELRPCFHECGLRIAADSDDARYLEQAARNVGASVTEAAGLKEYTNADAGWVDAEAAIRVLASRMPRRGVRFRRGDVARLIEKNGTTIGVELADGQSIFADRTILCTGAWQLTSIPTLATGQALGYIKLQNSDLLARMPVTMHLSSGWFVLPPHRGELKVGRHAAGYTRHVDGKSTPWMGPLPPDAEADLRAGLRRFIPQLADTPFHHTRLCWYSDTNTSDFLVDHLAPGLAVATGGSGHAFKFLPVLGRAIRLALDEGSPRWSLERARLGFDAFVQPDGSRDGSRGLQPRRELDGRTH